MTRRQCHELGVCQAPACPTCPRLARPAPRLAPGVIDGPYRRKHPVAVWAQHASAALRPVVAYLMGPHP